MIEQPNNIFQSIDIRVEGGYQRVEGVVADDKFYGILSDRWHADLRTKPLKVTERIRFERFIESLRGPRILANIVDVTNRRDADLYWPFLANGNLTVGLAANAGSEFLTIGGVGGANGTEIAQPGALFSIDNADGTRSMHKVATPATVTAGISQLTIWPRLRRNIAVGEIIDITTPSVSLRLRNIATRTPNTLRDETVVFSCQFREVK